MGALNETLALLVAVLGPADTTRRKERLNMMQTAGVKLGMHLLEVEVTGRCNLDCTHCYNRDRKRDDMPVAQILSLLEFAENNGVSSFVVSGGEASLHPQFDLLAKSLIERKPNTRTVLQTNGVARLKPMELLKAFKTVHVSYEPEGSDVRKVNSPELIKFACDVKSAGVYSYLFVTVHARNIDKVDAMVETAKQAGLDIGFNLCVSTHENTELSLSHEQALAVSRKLYELFLEKRILRFTSPLVAILNGSQSEGYIGNRGGCTAGIAACAVTVSGDVVPCPFFRTVIAGNINEQSLRDIWLSSPVFGELRDRSKFDTCGSCRYVSYCAGCRKRAFDTGKLTGHDPGCFLSLVTP
jgi:radical SAM protein with 4Fe4S-binding SPASM domain